MTFVTIINSKILHYLILFDVFQEIRLLIDPFFWSLRRAKKDRVGGWKVWVEVGVLLSTKGQMQEPSTLCKLAMNQSLWGCCVVIAIHDMQWDWEPPAPWVSSEKHSSVHGTKRVRQPLTQCFLNFRCIRFTWMTCSNTDGWDRLPELLIQ